MDRIMKRNKRKNKKKRKSTNSGSSSDKRQRFSGKSLDTLKEQRLKKKRKREAANEVKKRAKVLGSAKK